MSALKETLLKELAVLAEAGWTAGEIALHYQCSISTVRRYAKELGLSLSRDRSYGAMLLKQLIQQALPGYRLEEEYHLGERLRLDFYLPELQLAVEYDGRQHQEYTPYFHHTQDGFLEARQRDRRKEELCAQQGITLLRVTPGALPSPEELQALALAQLSQPTQESIHSDRGRQKHRNILSSPAFKEAQRAKRRAAYQRYKEWRTKYARAKSSSAAD